MGKYNNRWARWFHHDGAVLAFGACSTRLLLRSSWSFFIFFGGGLLARGLARVEYFFMMDSRIKLVREPKKHANERLSVGRWQDSYCSYSYEYSTVL